MNEEKRPIVALVTDAIYPYFRGGKEFSYHEVAQRLAQRADVHVFTMKWWDGPPTRREGQVTFRAIVPAAPHVLGRAPVIPRGPPVRARLPAAALVPLRRDRSRPVPQLPHLHAPPRYLAEAQAPHRYLARGVGPGLLARVPGPARQRRVAGGVALDARSRPPHRRLAADRRPGCARSSGDRASISVVPNGIDLDGIQELLSRRRAGRPGHGGTAAAAQERRRAARVRGAAARGRGCRSPAGSSGTGRSARPCTSGPGNSGSTTRSTSGTTSGSRRTSTR